MPLNALARFGICPTITAHKHIHAGAATAGLILTAALIAVPGAGTILIIKAIAILAAAQRAGLMLIGELIGCKASKLRQQVRPPAIG